MNGSVDRLAYTCILSIELVARPFPGSGPQGLRLPRRSRNEFMQDPIAGHAEPPGERDARLSPAQSRPVRGRLFDLRHPLLRPAPAAGILARIPCQRCRQQPVPVALHRPSRRGHAGRRLPVRGLGPQAGHGRLPVRLGAPDHPLRRGAQLDQPAPDPHADRDHLERPSRRRDGLCERGGGLRNPSALPWASSSAAMRSAAWPGGSSAAC